MTPKFDVIKHPSSSEGWVIRAFWRDGHDELLVGMYTSSEAARENIEPVAARWLQSLHTKARPIAQAS